MYKALYFLFNLQVSHLFELDIIPILQIRIREIKYLA